MKKVMIVDDNSLAAEGIEKNIDWQALDAEVSIIEYNSRSMCKLALSVNPMVKIILVSAYDKFEYAKRAIRLGAYDYIEKPLDYSYLTEKIQNAFLQLDKIRKNQELLKASRPLMTDKFFADLLHYPGEDPDIRLGSFLEYLDLKTDYDYFIVLVLEAEYTGRTLPNSRWNC